MYVIQHIPTFQMDAGPATVRCNPTAVRSCRAPAGQIRVEPYQRVQSKPSCQDLSAFVIIAFS